MCEVSVLFHRFARSNQTKPDPIWPMDCVPRISKMYVKGPWHKSLTLKSLKWNAVCQCLQITNPCLWRLHILGELLIHSFIAMKFLEANKSCHELDRSSFNLCQNVSMHFFHFTVKTFTKRPPEEQVQQLALFLGAWSADSPPDKVGNHKLKWAIQSRQYNWSAGLVSRAGCLTLSKTVSCSGVFV